MIRSVGCLVLLAVALFGTTTASPEYCDYFSGFKAGAVYIATDHFFTHTNPLIMIWVYAETNGVPDLQRGGAEPLLGVRDACQTPNPDLALARIGT